MRALPLLALLMFSLAQGAGAVVATFSVRMMYQGVLEVQGSGALASSLLGIRTNASFLHFKVTYIADASVVATAVMGKVLYAGNITITVTQASSTPPLPQLLELSSRNITVFFSEESSRFDPPILLDVKNGSVAVARMDWSGSVENVALFDISLVHVSEKLVVVRNETTVLVKDLYYEPVTGIPLLYSATLSVQSAEGALYVSKAVNGLYSSMDLLGLLSRAVYEFTTAGPQQLKGAIVVQALRPARPIVKPVNATCIEVGLSAQGPAYVAIEVPSGLGANTTAAAGQILLPAGRVLLYSGWLSQNITVSFSEPVDVLNVTEGGTSGGGIGKMPARPPSLVDLALSLAIVAFLSYAAYSLGGKLSAAISGLPSKASSVDG